MITGVIGKSWIYFRKKAFTNSRFTQVFWLGYSVFLLVILTIHKPAISQSQPINLALSTKQNNLTTEIVKQLLEELDYRVKIIQSVRDNEMNLSIAKGEIDIGIHKNQDFLADESFKNKLQVVGNLIKNTQDCQKISCEENYAASSRLQVVANKQFLRANPAIGKLLETIKIPLEDINRYKSLLTENSSKSFLENYAQEWISENQDRVQLWLTIARDAAIVAQSNDYSIGETSQSTRQNSTAAVLVQDNSTSKFPVMKVATKRFEPLVNYENDEYTGFSIDFWDAIANELGINYEVYAVDTIDKLLEQVKTKQANIAIAGITITAEREREIDFSHPYYESGLQILVPTRQTSLSQTMWGRIFSILTSVQLYRGIGIFVLILLVAAHIIWLTEHKSNPEFADTYWRGIWDAFWWAAVTVTTVGYGDKTPRKITGRIFGLFWMCAGYFIFAYFTATVTTSFTIDELNANIQGVEDLRGKEVATVIGTTADQYLQEKNINFVGYKTKEEAYLALKDQTVDAVVYDAPALKYYAAQEGAGKVKVVGKLFKLQDYGIALPINSPYRKDINSALLQLMENGTYQEISNKWFGS